MVDKKALEVFRGDFTATAKHFQDAIPVTARKYLQPDRLTRIALNALSKQPKLLQCTRSSVLLAVMDCVQNGLEPGGPLGHAYLVPFKNNKTNKFEATPIIGYKGYVTLAMRSGMFRAPPYVHLVYDQDRFELDLGGGEPPIHKFDHRIPTSDRGAVLGGYCVGKFTGGGSHIEWMGLDEIGKIQGRSKLGGSKYSPWATDTAQMQRKTVLRRAKNYWPLSGDLVVELAGAFNVDERADTGDRPDPQLIYEAGFLDDVAGIPDSVDADDAQASTGTDAALAAVKKTRGDLAPIGTICAAPDCNNKPLANGVKCRDHK
jgi:recombination protein RecT